MAGNDIGTGPSSLTATAGVAAVGVCSTTTGSISAEITLDWQYNLVGVVDVVCESEPRD